MVSLIRKLLNNVLETIANAPTDLIFPFDVNCTKQNLPASKPAVIEQLLPNHRQKRFVSSSLLIANLTIILNFTCYFQQKVLHIRGSFHNNNFLSMMAEKRLN